MLLIIIRAIAYADIIRPLYAAKPLRIGWYIAAIVDMLQMASLADLHDI